MTWFVWLKAAGGPRSQKVFGGAGNCPPSEDPLYRERDNVLSERILRQTEGLATLDELERRYPPPREALS